MGAGWCPPGILGIGVGGTAEKAMLLAKESLLDPIDMHELKATRAVEPHRRAAHRDLRRGERARHRRAGPRRADDSSRREDPGLSDARGIAAGRGHSQLRGDPPRALCPRWHPGRSSLPVPDPADWPEVEWSPAPDGPPRRISTPSHAQRCRRGRRGERLLLSGRMLTGRDAAHKRIADLLANGTRCRPASTFATGSSTTSDPVDPVARRSRRSRRTNDGHADGQVHGDDARQRRPARHDRQGGTRSGGDRRRSRRTRRCTLIGRRRRGIPRLARDQVGAHRSRFRTSAWKPMHEFEVENMPVMVAVDSDGNSIHETGPAEWRSRILRMNPV